MSVSARTKTGLVSKKLIRYRCPGKRREDIGEPLKVRRLFGFLHRLDLILFGVSGTDY